MLVTEAVKTKIIAVPLRFITFSGHITRSLLTVAFRKTILAVLKKMGLSRFVLIGCISPCSSKQTFSFTFASLVLKALRLLLPVIAFIILNLIYHNKKDIASIF